MKKLLTLVDLNAGLDPRSQFGIAWLAAFLGFVLILAVVLLIVVYSI
jgi:hypothetical protein